MLKAWDKRKSDDRGVGGIDLLLVTPAVIGLLFMMFWATSYYHARYTQMVVSERAAFAGVHSDDSYNSVESGSAVVELPSFGRCEISASTTTTTLGGQQSGIQVSSTCGNQTAGAGYESLRASRLPAYVAYEPWHSHVDCDTPGGVNCPTTTTIATPTTTTVAPSG